MLYAFVKSGIFNEPEQHPDSPVASPTKSTHASPAYGSRTDLAVTTLAGLIAVYSHTGSISVVALGLSHAVLEVFAFNLIERAHGVAVYQSRNGGSVIYSASGLLTQPTKPNDSREEPWVAMIRDTSAAAAVAITVTAFVLESRRFGGLAYYGIVGQAMGAEWEFGQGILSIVYGGGIVIVHMVMFGALLMMVSQQLTHYKYIYLVKRGTAHLPPPATCNFSTS